MHELLLIIVQSWSFQLLNTWNPTVPCIRSQQLMPPNEGVAKIDIGTKWPTAVNSAYLINISCNKSMTGPGNDYFYQCIPGTLQSFSQDLLGFSLRKNFFWKMFEKHVLPFSQTKDLLLGDQLSSPFRQSGSRKDLQQPSFSHILYPAHGWVVLTIDSLPSAVNQTFRHKLCSASRGG